ncbi:hypothetical protein [Marinospirillum sp.]|uniref:hypothetical protein n=1 Tax=Marinospirillum sp. TaxID=2183934 RepID=UPI00384B45AD
MSKPTGSIAELSSPEALLQSLKATRKLITEFERIQEDSPEQDTEKLEKLTQIREQLLFQTFSEDWTEETVNQYREQLIELQELDQQLLKLAEEVRSELHAKRSENQHNRKAVNAYGTAKGQFQR